MKSLGKLAGAILAATIAAAPSVAQSDADRTIRLVVPFAPGGSTDLVGRLVADKASAILGQRIIVENRPGAGGHIGSAHVASAKPDGLTVLLNGTAPFAISMAARRPMNYDPINDLKPVGELTRLPNVVTVNPELPVKSIPELVAYAKSNSGRLSYGMSAVGNLSHFNAEMFALAAGVKLVGVAYKGTGPLITDLIGGSIQVAFDNMPPFLAHIGGGKLRALAVTSATRSVLLPDVPALAEVGFPGFDHAAVFGIWGPAGLPDDQVRRLNSAFSQAVRHPSVVEQLAKSGIEPSTGAPEALGDRVRRERDQFVRVINDANIKLD